MATLRELRDARIEKLNRLRELGIDPYPSKSHRNTSALDILNNYEQFEGKEVVVAGRLMSWREHGPLIFGHLQDPTSKIQLYIRESELADTDVPNQTLGFQHLGLLDVGDLVEAKGIVTRTQRGEISVTPKAIRILTKAIRPLPDKWHGITDKEVMFRQRYLDMIMNPDKKWRFEKTAQITFAIREFMNNRGFLEIKTPFIQPVYGGTSAKPFKTHVNALGTDYYLAVAHELYLKRLITAGFENVYNISGYFRNEGIDRTHNPEFTMLETMTAYKNYEYNMELVEEMYRYIAQKVFNRTVFKIRGQEVDFGKPWEKISMLDAVKKYAGYDFNEVKTLEEAHKILGEVGVKERPSSIGESMVLVCEEKVEEQLIQPTFLTSHPVEISALAKQMPSDPRFAERFEIYIGGIEGGDNWTELNDPIELFNRFKDQQKRKAEGNEEAHPMDIEFVEMMEYGMPPTTGLGPGIERLAMMLTETEYIDDVIFFPMLRPASITDTQKELYGEDTFVVNEKSPSSGKVAHVNEVASEDKANHVTEGVTDQDFSKKIVIVVNRDLENWQIANAIGHVSAYMGHKLDEKFDTGEHFTTSDGKNHPRNSQYPIITLSAKPGQMSNLMEKVRESGLLYHGFIKEMIETTNDNEIVDTLKNKKDQELEYLAIGFFGENDKVDALTKKFSLYK